MAISEVYNMNVYDYRIASNPLFDVIEIDMPYGTLKVDWDIKPNLSVLIPFLYSLLQPDGTLIFFCQQPLTSEIVMALGKRFSHEIIWHKTQKLGFPNANRMPLRAHETIIIAKHKKGCFYSPDMIQRGGGGRVKKQAANRYKGYSDMNEHAAGYTDTGLKYPESVIKISNHNGAIFGNKTKVSKHQTQKPPAIYTWLFKNYCKPNCRIFSPFTGSGSSRIAAYDLGFDYEGTELSAEIFNEQEERFATHLITHGNVMFKPEPEVITQSKLFAA